MKLFDFFLRKQRLVEEAIFDYLSKWKKCLEDFKAGMEVYLNEGLGERFDYYVEQVHKAEERADELRRKVEWEMYSKALIPESRGDMLGFLETMDKIPNRLNHFSTRLNFKDLNFPKN